MADTITVTFGVRGIPVVVSKALTGAKQAVFTEGTLHVSPAMFELMRHAEGDELEKLLANIPMVQIRLPPLHDMMREVFDPKWLEEEPIQMRSYRRW
jgi:hypothetical protein